MDHFRTWPAACLCKTSDGQTDVKFLEQNIQLNGIPPTIRPDNASAFTSHHFREWERKEKNVLKRKKIPSIQETVHSYSNQLCRAGGKSNERKRVNKYTRRGNVWKSTRLSLGCNANTPITKFSKSAFDLQFCKEPNTEWGNMLNQMRKTLTKNFLSKTRNLESFTFNGKSGSFNHLSMKQIKIAIFCYPLNKKHKENFSESFFPITISLNSNVFEEEPTSRGTGQRGPEGGFAEKTRGTDKTNRQQHSKGPNHKKSY